MGVPLFKQFGGSRMPQIVEAQPCKQTLDAANIGTAFPIAARVARIL
jgi:hypothetical protein